METHAVLIILYLCINIILRYSYINDSSCRTGIILIWLPVGKYVVLCYIPTSAISPNKSSRNYILPPFHPYIPTKSVIMSYDLMCVESHVSRDRLASLIINNNNNIVRVNVVDLIIILLYYITFKRYSYNIIIYTINNIIIVQNSAVAGSEFRRSSESHALTRIWRSFRSTAKKLKHFSLLFTIRL